MDPLIRVVLLAVYSTCMAIVLLALWHWRPAALLTPVKFLTNLASRRVGLCIFMLCAIAPAIRLLEVPWLGIPDPRIHDEFNHLLIADTLVSGKALRSNYRAAPAGGSATAELHKQ